LAGTSKTNLKTTSTSSATEKVFQAQATLPAKGLCAQAKFTAKTALAKSNPPVMAVSAKAARLKTSPAFLSATSGRVSDSGLRGRAAVSSTPSLSSAIRNSSSLCLNLGFLMVGFVAVSLTIRRRRKTQVSEVTQQLNQ
jgi:hypothetical protein